MGRFIAFLYGIASYMLFFVTFLYAIGFVAGLVVPKTIDTGTVVPIVEAFSVNLLLMSVFAFQHSVMARRLFKRGCEQFVPNRSNAAPTSCSQALRSSCCSGNGGRSLRWSGISTIRR